jgi:hypothetical protein
MITGASSKVPVVATQIGNATVASGTADCPIHLPCVGLHIVGSLPPNLILVGISCRPPRSTASGVGSN